MCGIFASADSVRFLELLEANSKRGNHCTTITTFKKLPDGAFVPFEQFRTYGGEDLIPLVMLVGVEYIVGHVQAPTQGLNINMGRSHPHALDNGDLLWHNGIIKPNFCKTIQAMLSTNDEWDTALLHRYLDSGLSDLGKIDGAFACLKFTDNKFYAFRNTTSPLFYGHNGGDMPDISSVKTQLTRHTMKFGNVFELGNELKSVMTFNNINTPYYIPEQK